MKRTFWTGVGYSLGLGTSVVVQRRVRRTIDRYAPEQIRADLSERGRTAAARAREAAIDLRAAAREGVAAMRDERNDLLAEFGPGDASQAAPRHGSGEPTTPRFRPRNPAQR